MGYSDGDINSNGNSDTLENPVNADTKIWPYVVGPDWCNQTVEADNTASTITGIVL